MSPRDSPGGAGLLPPSGAPFTAAPAVVATVLPPPQSEHIRGRWLYEPDTGKIVWEQGMSALPAVPGPGRWEFEIDSGKIVWNECGDVAGPAQRPRLAGGRHDAQFAVPAAGNVPAADTTTTGEVTGARNANRANRRRWRRWMAGGALLAATAGAVAFSGPLFGYVQDVAGVTENSAYTAVAVDEPAGVAGGVKVGEPVTVTVDHTYPAGRDIAWVATIDGTVFDQGSVTVEPATTERFTVTVDVGDLPGQVGGSHRVEVRLAGEPHLLRWTVTP
jgi:hypothetical protein